MKLSILIPTVTARVPTFFNNITIELEKQIKESGRNDVEVLGFYDNKTRSVGEKRNGLIQLATGEFLTFVDDDDRIASNYINSIMKTLDEKPDADCVVYDVICTINKGKPIYCRYSIDYEYNWDKVNNKWFGKPSHTMVWKSEIAKKYIFIDKNYGEDTEWVLRAYKDIKKEVKIHSVLYFYDFNDKTTETRLK